MNMALDEITAETGAAGGPWTLRVYRWEPSTLSPQQSSIVEDAPRFAAVSCGRFSCHPHGYGDGEASWPCLHHRVRQKIRSARLSSHLLTSSPALCAGYLRDRRSLSVGRDIETSVLPGRDRTSRLCRHENGRGPNEERLLVPSGVNRGPKRLLAGVTTY